MNEPPPGAGRTVVVGGATGYLGRHVVQALHRDGWVVRALVRDEARLAEAREAADEVFVGQATEAHTLAGLFDGAHAAFSSIGIHSFRRRPTYEEVDLQANMNLVDGAEAAGVQRFVFISVFGGPQMRTRSPVAEARERVADRLRASPMTEVILRPTGFFNDMSDIFAMARRGKVWLVGSGETRINPIHGADLAEVIASVMAADEPARALDVGGPDTLSQVEIAELAFRVLGKKPRYGRISPATVRLVARLLRPFNKNAAGLAMGLSMLGDMDLVGQSFGSHHLEDLFVSLAQDAGA